jgi:hypothetical protein
MTNDLALAKMVNTALLVFVQLEWQTGTNCDLNNIVVEISPKPDLF